MELLLTRVLFLGGGTYGFIKKSLKKKPQRQNKIILFKLYHIYGKEKRRWPIKIITNTMIL